MRVGSLFSGIGAMDYGFQLAGMEIVYQVEIDPFCQRILAKQFPNTKKYWDIRQVSYPESVDILAGGFPCQDVSIMGKQEGLSGKQSGLWGEFARIIRETKPRWVVVENVTGLLSINSGRDFGRVLADLAQSGYDATWGVLTARAFGAPHLRERVVLIANPDGKRLSPIWEKEVHRFEGFSWCKDIRRVEDLRERPDLPQPLLLRIDNGSAKRLHALGNGVVPALSEYVGRRILEMEKL